MKYVDKEAESKTGGEKGKKKGYYLVLWGVGSFLT